jgi:hypothetical protein
VLAGGSANLLTENADCFDCLRLSPRKERLDRLIGKAAPLQKSGRVVRRLDRVGDSRINAEQAVDEARVGDGVEGKTRVRCPVYGKLL